MDSSVSTRSRPTYSVGFVCEGSTDYVVLREVAAAALGTINPVALQPQVDQLDRSRPGGLAGWSEVKAWCEQHQDLGDVLRPPIGEPLDLLVIAIDLDIAIRAGVERRPENLSSYDAAQLCRVVKSWLPARVPREVVIVIPVMSIESWVVCALFPRHKRPEAMDDPAEFLAAKGKIPRATSRRPWKRAREYRAFAKEVAAKLLRVRKRCGEADRFVRKVTPSAA